MWYEPATGCYIKRAATTVITRISQGGFCIALSGGGHRATLATLGALMAIVDRGLGPKVIQISSVSGGSITNAFVAQRVLLNELGPGQLDTVAEELTNTVVRKGVLTRSWLLLVLGLPVVIGTGGAAVLLTRTSISTAIAVAVGIIVSLAGLIARGLAVEWLLDCRYFRCRSKAATPPNCGRAKLSALSGQGIDHVLCMTDLASGLPVYASSQYGGFIWRRLHGKDKFYGYKPFQTFAASHLSLAELVRASAAFPGIPPRRLPIPADPAIGVRATVAFLGDGGVWNNLGTQTIREDRFIGTLATWERGVLRPSGRAPEYLPLLCFNGSAPLRPSRPFLFGIPLFASFKSIWQVLEIQNANTVLPRIHAIRRAFTRRAWTGTRPDHMDPADLIADLRPTEDLADDLGSGTWGVDSIQRSDPSVKEWEKEALIRIRLARDNINGRLKINRPEVDWLAHILNVLEPRGSPTAAGIADIDDWDALRCSKIWKELVAEYGIEDITAPTTLGRIDAKLARNLIARGYLNTYLVSLFLARLGGGELERLTDLPRRLNKIAGFRSISSRENSPQIDRVAGEGASVSLIDEPT